MKLSQGNVNEIRNRNESTAAVTGISGCSLMKRLLSLSLAMQLVEKLITIAEECQNIQLKKLKDICEK